MYIAYPTDLMYTRLAQLWYDPALTVEGIARALGTSKTWVYHHRPRAGLPSRADALGGVVGTCEACQHYRRCVAERLALSDAGVPCESALEWEKEL